MQPFFMQSFPMYKAENMRVTLHEHQYAVASYSSPRRREGTKNVPGGSCCFRVLCVSPVSVTPPVQDIIR